MAYSNFTLAKVKEDFGLTIDETQNLFADVEGVKPSEILTLNLTEYIPLATAIDTEKARSEFIIAPVLSEVRRQVNYQASLFSGTDFNVDVDKGLQGYCDFIISCSAEQFYINAPVITIAEAKNEKIKSGFGQCIAEMIAAQIFNQRAGNEIDKIYGAVTTGTAWRFLVLEEHTVLIDRLEYYIKEVDKILAILLQPIQAYLTTSTGGNEIC
ncbi:MAG: hypothetical protein RID09_14650 [Coleofasciculus sp. G1-WW12-02]|uniref:hypothetical protein n=1 Tax=Coleofasciculus sp. G1-WW12-02 TaxID=3068483 RepID=UPI0032F16D76